jgi:tetratricopeptide (TPR) repeat protein
MRGGETVSATRPGGDALQGVAALRADVVALLREKRYEETLAALYRARSESPNDLELQKSIEQLKEFLVGTYAKRLGGLDRVATTIPISAVRTPDAVLLARYIDGTSTYGDLAQICPLGQLRTLQVLIGLYCGSEPPRIYGIESARVYGVETPRAHHDPPTSGLRGPDGPVEPFAVEVATRERDDADRGPPDTARSASVAAAARAFEDENDRQYKELFALGTAAFVQRRFTDSAELFESCLQLRPDDRAATVMLRRSLDDGEGRSG